MKANHQQNMTITATTSGGGWLKRTMNLVNKSKRKAKGKRNI